MFLKKICKNLERKLLHHKRWNTTEVFKMGGKRKHDDSDAREVVHESRQFQVYGNDSKPAKKPCRHEPKVYKKPAHASSVNDVKKRIRDVTRRLERVGDLPANVRVEDERALAAYQQELAAAEAEKIRQKMIKKYHMVRFFGKVFSSFSLDTGF